MATSTLSDGMQESVMLSGSAQKVESWKKPADAQAITQSIHTTGQTVNHTEMPQSAEYEARVW